MRAGNRVDAEVLDAELPGVDSDLEVLRIDRGTLDFAALDLGLDDRRPTRFLGRHGALARARSETHQERNAQKKNENPAFHSLTSSLSSRLVKTT